MVSSAASQLVATTTRSAAAAASAFVAGSSVATRGPHRALELADDLLGPGPVARAGEDSVAGRGELRREAAPGGPGGPQHPDFHAVQHGTARPARRPARHTLGR